MQSFVRINPAGNLWRHSEDATTKIVESDSVLDTGNAMIGICADVVGFELDPGDQEPCLLVFTCLVSPV